MTPPISYLRECFLYNPNTGYLVWKHRPLHHFKSSKEQKKWNNQYPGKVAGSKFKSGNNEYILIRLQGGQAQIYAHRIIWALVKGHWPLTRAPSHINDIGTDNRWVNLSPAKGGARGTTRTPEGRWMARISSGGVSHYLGTFDTEEEAHEAYERAKSLPD